IGDLVGLLLFSLE
ncbi:hypothetical protein A2U01_0114277, partial [Trifolium medium]|nr:hypothetical protein [Trifolium medium]